MSQRREFITGMAASAALISFPGVLSQSVAENLKTASTNISNLSPEKSARDEDFWSWVRASYTVSRNIINLNNGGVSPQPLITQDALDKYTRLSNEAPSFYMWRTLNEGREPLRGNLAQLAGCSPEEIAINRNSTEGLNTIIFGLNLKRGDEVVLSKYDYPSMINALEQRVKREGIVLKWVDLELPSSDDDYILSQFEKQFTSKTKLVLITHIINWTGQILPVAKIARSARHRGIESLCDAAHSFAHLDYKIPDLECDYFATSLHKWLCAPFGSGMMWIRKDKIKNVWALLSSSEPDSGDMMKFESIGTRNFPAEMAIGYSLDFHNSIGQARKRARLHYLKNYWASQASEIKNVTLNTSLDPNYSCALANFSIAEKKSTDIASTLWKDYKIHTVGIVREKIDGVRVTPHIYTSLAELDKLVRAIGEIAKT
jgi:selenocysteine lyase/cysteine desulfurase